MPKPQLSSPTYMKRFTLLAFLPLLIFSLANGQNSPVKPILTPTIKITKGQKSCAAPNKDYVTKCTAKPFDHQVFIENGGQFDDAIQSQSKVLYAAQLGGVFAYFTSSGIVCKYEESVKDKDAIKAEGGKGDPDYQPL